MKIQQVIEAGNVRIPIVHVSDAGMNITKANLYLVGSQRITINIQRDKLMCRVGGGYEEFGEYLLRNHRQEERKLVILMIKTQESLEWVVSALIAGRKQIRNVLKENNEAAQKEMKKSRSAIKNWRQMKTTTSTAKLLRDTSPMMEIQPKTLTPSRSTSGFTFPKFNASR